MTKATAAQIGAIHVISKTLGMDEEARRGLIASLAGGKRSSRDLTSAEAIRVVDRLKELQGGRRTLTAKGARIMEGEYASKLVALWLSGWHLGVIRDRTDAALLSFVEAQTGISHVRFLRDPKDARAAIEALKMWLAREAGVIWPGRDEPRANKIAVHDALLHQIQRADGDTRGRLEARDMTEPEIDAEIRALGAYLRKLLKKGAENAR